MITKPTVLVIGAGASMPYGFPSGKELRDRICAHEFSSAVRNEHGSRAIDSFTDAFRGSHVYSIDAFLSRRPEFVDIGKLTIASIISQSEDPRVFLTPIDDDWYSLLWNKLISGIHTVDDLSKNNIKIITFNYDRSLEYFLITSISNTFGVSRDEALIAIKHIPIMHFYGQLGDLNWKYSPTELPYKNDHHEDCSLNASQGIKIIPEARNDMQSSGVIVEWFLHSRNIFFLGFGFDSLNIERLGLKETLENNFGGDGRVKPLIMASTLGLTKAEISLAGSSLAGQDLVSIWRPFHGRNTETLRNFADVFI